jgi:hypothetical protein
LKRAIFCCGKEIKGLRREAYIGTPIKQACGLTPPQRTIAQDSAMRQQWLPKG